MALAQVRLPDRCSSRLRAPTTRPLKGSYGSDVTFSDACRQTLTRNCEFAPTRKLRAECTSSCTNNASANRFGVLADLASSPARTSWAFDFTRPLLAPARRRGKRGGKHNRVRLEAQRRREASKSESVGKSCDELPAPTPQVRYRPVQSAL
jgi:hypothetical protein